MKRPNVLLINPPVFDFSAYDLWSKPLGLLYIAAVLREQGCKISLIDAMDRWDTEAKSFLKSRQYMDGYYIKQQIDKPEVFKSIPRKYYRFGLSTEVLRNRINQIHQDQTIDAICVTSGMTYWYQGVFETIQLCKEVLPDVPVVLGGIYATLYSDHAKRFSGADLVMSGPAENQVAQWICEWFGLRRKKHYHEIDDYPLPAYDLYPGTGHAALLTTRGCPFQCSFCATSRFHSNFAQRSPEQVVEELKFYYNQLNIKEIAFYDDALFAFANRHIKPLLKSVINRGMNVHFHSPNGLFAKYVDQELAELMVNSGFKTIRLSFETNDYIRQKDMKKVSNVDLINAITYLESAGFPRRDIKVYLLMGLSGQSPLEVENSVRFVHDLGVRISMSSYSPIPGTTEWNNDVRLLPGLEHEPLLTNKSIYPMKNDRFTYDDYEKLKSMVSLGNRVILENIR